MFVHIILFLFNFLNSSIMIMALFDFYIFHVSMNITPKDESGKKKKKKKLIRLRFSM